MPQINTLHRQWQQFGVGGARFNTYVVRNLWKCGTRGNVGQDLIHMRGDVGRDCTTQFARHAIKRWSYYSCHLRART